MCRDWCSSWGSLQGSGIGADLYTLYHIAKLYYPGLDWESATEISHGHRPEMLIHMGSCEFTPSLPSSVESGSLCRYLTT